MLNIFLGDPAKNKSMSKNWKGTVTILLLQFVEENYAFLVIQTDTIAKCKSRVVSPHHD